MEILNFDAESKAIEADLALLAKHHDAANRLKNHRLRGFILYKIERWQKVFLDINKMLQDIILIEKKFENFNVDDHIRAHINESIYFLNHVSERYLYAGEGPELNLAKEIPKEIRSADKNTMKKLQQELGITELGLVSSIKKWIDNILNILAKHKPDSSEEKKQINDLLKKTKEIRTLIDQITSSINHQKRFLR